MEAFAQEQSAVLTPQEKALSKQLRKLDVPTEKIAAVVVYSRAVSAFRDRLPENLFKINFNGVTEQRRYEILDTIGSYLKRTESSSLSIAAGGSELKNGSFDVIMVAVPKPTYEVSISKGAVSGIASPQFARSGEPLTKEEMEKEMRLIAGTIGYRGGDILMSYLLLSPITLYESGQMISAGVKESNYKLAMGGFIIGGIEIAATGPFFKWASKPTQITIRDAIKIAARRELGKIAEETGARAAGKTGQTEADRIAASVVEGVNSRLSGKALTKTQQRDVIGWALKDLNLSEETIEKSIDNTLKEPSGKLIDYKVKRPKPTLAKAAAGPTAIENVAQHRLFMKDPVYIRARDNLLGLDAFQSLPDVVRQADTRGINANLRNMTTARFETAARKNFDLSKTGSEGMGISGVKIPPGVKNLPPSLETEEIVKQGGTVKFKGRPIGLGNERLVQEYVPENQLPRALEQLGLPSDPVAVGVFIHGTPEQLRAYLDMFYSIARVKF